MKIQEITLRNFKSFGEAPESICFSDLTSLVGANSSGKSNILKALDLFFDYSKSKVVKDLFHNGDPSEPIEIAITFGQLDDDERRIFLRNLSPDGSLRIIQRISVTLPESEDSTGESQDIESISDCASQEKRGIHAVAVPEVVEWLSLDHMPTEQQVRDWWEADLLIGDVDFKGHFETDDIPSPAAFKRKVDRFWEKESDLIPQIPWLNITKKPTKTSIGAWWETDLAVSGISFKSYFADQASPPSPDEFLRAVELFWEEHGDAIAVMRYEASEKVLGWANKLKGNLPRLIYIPAIRHVHEEIKVAKTNPFGMLLGWLLGDITQSRKDELQTRINEALEQVFAQEPEADEEQRRIDQIRETLNRFVQEQFDIEIDFEFLPPKIDALLSTGVELVGDDGYRSAIQEKGQGVQRSVIFAVLRTYCRHREQLEGAPGRNHIFAIEEPEICLHPAIKRATHSLLRKLSSGQDQVVYSTHDGYFVNVRYFDEVRVLRRTKQASDDWATRVWHFPIHNLILDAKNRYGIEVSGESIRERFGRFYDAAKNEGFFAKMVLLVEGPTEEYSLPVYFRALGFDVDQEQVAVISAGSVEHLDFLYIVFNELGIPCYVVFDGDKPSEPFDPSNMSSDQLSDLRRKSRRNAELLKLFGKPELVDNEAEFFFPPTQITDRLAVFEHKFEIEIHHALPEYNQLKAEAKRLFGTDSKPLTARYIANQVVHDPGNIPQYVRDILDRVKGCRRHGSCLMLEKCTE